MFLNITHNQKFQDVALKYPEILSYSELVNLVSDVYSAFKGNAVRVFQSEPKLVAVIEKFTKFLNVIDKITFKTRLKYVLDGITHFKTCSICGKPIIENIKFLYQELPSVHCKCQISGRKLALTYINRDTNPYFKQNNIMFDELYKMVSENPRTFVMKLKSKCSRIEYKDYSHLVEWINSSLPLLSDIEYDYTTKCRWIFEGRADFPVCPICGSCHGFKHKKLKLNVGYAKYCSVKCEKSDPAYWESVRAGCERNNGVRYPMQCKEIVAKKMSKYEFDNVKFDSSSEVIAYLYFKDNADNAIVRNSKTFKYEFAGQTHFYIPDFYSSKLNKYIEVKGKQFINDDGTMKQVWHKQNATDEQKAMADAKEEARRQCMLANDIMLIIDPSSEMTKMRKYVKSAYGKNFVKTLKRKNKI